MILTLTRPKKKMIKNFFILKFFFLFKFINTNLKGFILIVMLSFNYFFILKNKIIVKTSKIVYMLLPALSSLFVKKLFNVLHLVFVLIASLFNNFFAKVGDLLSWRTLDYLLVPKHNLFRHIQAHILLGFIG